MSSKYSVDDILNEVRRKKASANVSATKPADVPEKKPEVWDEKPAEKPHVAEEKPHVPEEKPADVPEEKLDVPDEKPAEKINAAPPSSVKDISLEKTAAVKIEEPLTDDKKALSDTDLIKLRTEEFSALGESMDKAEAWETFVKITEMREENSPKEAREEFKEEIDDYIEKDDERSIRYDIKSLKVRVALRMWVCLIFGGALLGLMLLSSVSSNTGFLSEFFSGGLYLPCVLALTVIPCLFCLSTVFGGLWSLIRFKADSDSPVGLAVLSVLIFNIVMLLNPEVYAGGGYFTYNAAAVFCLAFNAWGKLYVLKRAMCNFGFLTSDSEKYAVLPVETEHLADKLSRSFSFDRSPTVVLSRKVGFLKDFLKYSYAEDSADRTVKITAPITLFASLAVSAVSFVFTKDIFRALNIFALMNVMCSPFGQIMSTNVPLLRASKKALRHGGMISGYVSAEDFSMTDAIVVDSDELFPRGTIKLHGIKTFEGQRIDEAILDAASVVVAAGTTLKEVFSDIIDDRRDMLKPVDTLVYEDSMGVSGWVDSKRVLIGNRTLMENHNIVVPSKDYEEKYLSEGTDAIYLANSGTLTAMFVVSYSADRETEDALYNLRKCGVKVLVRTTDPNITGEKLSEVFSISEDLFAIVPSALHNDYKKERSALKASPASAAHTGRFPAFAAIITASVKAKRAMGIAGFFNAAGLIISYILVTLLAIMGAEAGEASETVVLIYQLVLCFFTAVLPSLKRY